MLNQMMSTTNTAAVAVTPPIPASQTKDTQWLTLEVCREFQRNKCTRSDTECKYAHPPPHVEVQNGRVTACFDSIKGKCQRKEPPCKYLHPPQHLKEVLLQNGRRNLILKNSMISPYLSVPTYVHPGYTPIMYDIGAKGLTYPGGLVQAQTPYMAHPYYATQSPQLLPWQHYINNIYPNVPVPLQPVTDNSAAVIAQQVPSIGIPQPIPSTTPTQKVTRPDRLENTIPGMVPITKRMAIADKGGIPMYQPAMTVSAYQQALAAMQLGQPQYIPTVTAAATYSPHPASITRF